MGKQEERWMDLYIATGRTKDSPRILPNEFLYRMKHIINSEVTSVLEDVSKQSELLYDSQRDAPFYAVPMSAIQTIKERYNA